MQLKDSRREDVIGAGQLEHDRSQTVCNISLRVLSFKKMILTTPPRIFFLKVINGHSCQGAFTSSWERTEPEDLVDIIFTVSPVLKALSVLKPLA